MDFEKTIPFNNGKTENGEPNGYEASAFLSYGHMLRGRYRVERVLGEGGFGITYECCDTTLDMRVAVKEYFPQGFVSRDTNHSPTITYTASSSGRSFIEKGREQFLREAKILARFSGEKGIVNVRDFFEENNTAYIVMEFLDGQDLKQIITARGRIPAPEAVRMLMPVMESLEKIHRQGLIHRDISPDNIRLAGSTVKLLDFGAARNVTFGDNQSMTVVLKHGYAPIEQYSSSGVQGPWTDVYALCATLYLCITGKKPVDAPGRMPTDNLTKPSQLGVAIDPNIENVIMKGLGLARELRYATVQELMDDFNRALGGMYIPEAQTVMPQQMPVNYAPTYTAQPQTYQPSVQPVPPAGVSSFVQEQPKKKVNKGIGLVVMIIAAVIILVVAIVIGIGAGKSSRREPDSTSASTSSTTASTEESTEPSTEPTTETTTETTTINPRELYLPGNLGYCTEYTMYVKSNHTSVFFGPDSSEYDRYDQLASGDTVTVLTNSLNGWVLIKFGNNRAWVEKNKLSDIVMYNTEWGSSGVELYDESLGDYGMINVYAGPGWDYGIIGEINNGSTGDQLGYCDHLNTEWTFYRFSNGLTGWVHDDLIWDAYSPDDYVEDDYYSYYE